VGRTSFFWLLFAQEGLAFFVLQVLTREKGKPKGEREDCDGSQCNRNHTDADCLKDLKYISHI